MCVRTICRRTRRAACELTSFRPKKEDAVRVFFFCVRDVTVHQSIALLQNS